MGWEVSAAKSAATASAASGAAATTGSSAFLGRLFSRSSALSAAEVSAAKSAATASAASGAAATTGSSAFLGRLFSRSSALSAAREDPADALESEIPPTSHPALCLATTAVPSSASAAFDDGWRCRAPHPALPKTRVWSGSATGRDARKRGQTRRRTQRRASTPRRHRRLGHRRRRAPLRRDATHAMPSERVDAQRLVCDHASRGEHSLCR